MSKVRDCNVKSCDRVRGVGLDQHYHISYSYNFVTSSWTLVQFLISLDSVIRSRSVSVN